MLLLALRNLFEGKARFVMSTAGLGLALLLVLVLDAIWAGSESQISAYIDRSGADVWVAQQGVRNMHMASSSLPVTTVPDVELVPGVRSVTPILYVLGTINTPNANQLAYVIGLPPSPAAGTPWAVVKGAGVPRSGEAIIDRTVASNAGVDVGGVITVLNHRFTVVGLTAGTLNIVNSIAFISLGDFMALRRSQATISYLLVRTAAGSSPSSVRTAIERQVPGVTALTTAEFSEQERAVVAGMSTDVVAIMNLVGLLIGLAVMALSTYTAVLSRRSEFGVLKALGARNADLYVVVIVQTAIALAFGLAVGIALTWLLSVGIPLVKPSLALEMTPASLAKVTSMALVIAVLAAILPVWQLARLDPAIVFRRKVA